eukprot:scaffold45035_cov49-Attheya_sp.AAC.1
MDARTICSSKSCTTRVKSCGCCGCCCFCSGVLEDEFVVVDKEVVELPVALMAAAVGVVVSVMVA